MKTFSIIIVAFSLVVFLLSVEGFSSSNRDRSSGGRSGSSSSRRRGGYSSHGRRHQPAPTPPPAPIKTDQPPPLYPPPRTCGSNKPPEGRWLVWHYLQQDLTNSTLTLQAVSNMTLKVEFGNENFTAYSGNAVGEFCCGGQVPDGVPLTLDMVAKYDPKDCSLSGSMYNYQGLNFSVATTWWYDGKGNMYGIFVDTIEWTTVVPGFAAHRLEYVGITENSRLND